MATPTSEADSTDDTEQRPQTAASHGGGDQDRGDRDGGETAAHDDTAAHDGGDTATQDSHTASKDGSAETRAGDDQGDSHDADDQRNDADARHDADAKHDADAQDADQGDGKPRLDRSDESQNFVDQSVMDFDPDDGLYSGTVVDGSTEIDGPHIGEDGTVDEEEQKKFLEDGKQQAKEEGLLDADDQPTDKGSQAKGSGETSEDSQSDA